jgi:N-acetylglucosamine-6-phosphate deacetylase
MLTIDAGRIAALAPSDSPEPCSRVVTPALIDLQVNGFHGFDLNASSPSSETVQQCVLALRSTGTGLCCPTITTGSYGHLCRALRAVAGACDADAAVAHAVAGIHLEGPYISPVDGPRGAHPLPYVRPPDWDEFERFQEAARGRIGMVTLAPELPEALPFIERAVASGVRVALGHLAATSAQLDDAVRAGATLSTHLGNAAHAQLPRHPNYVWDQLGDDRLNASFILDGHHLAPPVVRSMLRAKGVERSILVTDAVFLAGLSPRKASFMGLTVELLPEQKVVLTGTPFLAGSALQMSAAVNNAMAFAGVSMPSAVAMASSNPARWLGVDEQWGTLAPGRGADLALWDVQPSGQLELAALLARGEVVWGSVQ